jgi:hypothetical protein
MIVNVSETEEAGARCWSHLQVESIHRLPPSRLHHSNLINPLAPFLTALFDVEAICS